MSTNIEEIAQKIQEAIWLDLTDRRGIKQEINNCDKDVQEEIKATHISIIKVILEKINE